MTGTAFVIYNAVNTTVVLCLLIALLHYMKMEKYYQKQYHDEVTTSVRYRGKMEQAEWKVMQMENEVTVAKNLAEVSRRIIREHHKVPYRYEAEALGYGYPSERARQRVQQMRAARLFG